jgi:hypothetical protein
MAGSGPAVNKSNPKGQVYPSGSYPLTETRIPRTTLLVDLAESLWIDK